MNRNSLIVVGLVALSLVVGLGYLSSCSTKVESPLTGKPVPLSQAYQDLETKQDLDKAASEREAAAAAAEAARLREQEAADLAKAQAERDRRSDRERREHERFVQAVTSEAQAKVREASDKLADSQALSDAELEAAVASIRSGVQAQIDAKAQDVEAKARERLEANQRQQAAIDAAAKADAEKWAVINGIWDAAKPVLGVVPGGEVLGGGINAVLALLAGGGGLAALRERSKRAKSEEEKQQREALIADLEAQQATVAARARTLSKGVVGIVDSIEVIKDKVGRETWDRIKQDVRGWQGPEAEALVDAARNHQDPLAALVAKDLAIKADAVGAV
jgi:hypothetical protein